MVMVVLVSMPMLVLVLVLVLVAAAAAVVVVVVLTCTTCCAIGILDVRLAIAQRFLRRTPSKRQHDAHCDQAKASQHHHHDHARLGACAGVRGGGEVRVTLRTSTRISTLRGVRAVPTTTGRLGCRTQQRVPSG